jgi:hypothetical protein
MKIIEIKNCTPHEIVVRNENGKDIVFPASGIIPRIATTQVVVGELLGIPIVKNKMGSVENLPNYKEGTYLIVSGMVKEAMPERTDLISPDTGVTCIREDGKIKAVTRFNTNLE